MWSLPQQEQISRYLLQPRSAGEVALILDIVREYSCPFAVKSGGHGAFAGASNIAGGVAIDLLKMSSVQLSDDHTTVGIGPGMRWTDVYKYLEIFGLSVLGSRDGGVGVGGSVLGGGLSFFNGNHGWSCDNVRGFEVVLPNGTVIKASSSSSPDVYFALRGGGNNFGIVTNFVIDTFAQGPVVHVGRIFSIQEAQMVFDSLEKATDHPVHNLMLLVAINWHPKLQRYSITKKSVHSRPAEYVDDDVVGVVVTMGETNMSDISREMDLMNPRGYYQRYASMTVKNNAKLNMQILRLFQEELDEVKDANGLTPSIVFNPLTKRTMEPMRRRNGNAFGLKSLDGPLTIINISLAWSDVSDNSRMKAFVQRFTAKSIATAKETGRHNPYIFLNHADEYQDVFSSYSEENANRLLMIQRQIDAEGGFQTLQPGGFKLKNSDFSLARQHDEL